jgi:hypothetical protein
MASGQARMNSEASALSVAELQPCTAPNSASPAAAADVA